MGKMDTQDAEMVLTIVLIITRALCIKEQLV
jgi:hypothetical protein